MPVVVLIHQNFPEPPDFVGPQMPTVEAFSQSQELRQPGQGIAYEII